MLKEQVVSKANATFRIIVEVAAVAGAIVALGGAFTWYKNNFWTPIIIVNSVDYDNGVANLTVNGTPMQLLGDTSYSAGGNWAVQFGIVYVNGKLQYDRIELTKFGNVVKYVAQQAAPVSATAAATNTSTTSKGFDGSDIVTCQNCGWQWHKSDSNPKDMYVCHHCGFDNSNYHK